MSYEDLEWISKTKTFSMLEEKGMLFDVGGLGHDREEVLP